MTDEEKKAIEDLKEVVELYNDKCLITTEDDFKSIEILLNLIEKQSKEIEELKKYEEGYKLLSYSLDNYTSKDKIKAEIEELQEDIKYSANPLSIDNSKFGIKVLQSLL